MERNMEIAAIDVGYGTTCVASNVGNSEKDYVFFPSLAIKVDPTKQRELGLQDIARRESTIVNVGNETFYEVGPGVIEKYRNDQERQLGKRFVKSPEYRALFLAGLNQVQTDTIDLLVGGLPNNNMQERQELIELMEGTHQVGGRTITVKKAMVFPQPFGALIHYAAKESYKHNVDLMNVLGKGTRSIIDPGYGTLDILTSSGLVIDEDRTDGTGHGHRKLIKQISEQLSHFFNAHIGIELIDQAFISGKLEIFGTSYDFPMRTDDLQELKSLSRDSVDCFKIIEEHCESGIKTLNNMLGDAVDVKEILVCGGTAPYYKEVIERVFPRNRVLLVPDHEICVCLGLAQLALQISASLEQQAATA